MPNFELLRLIRQHDQILDQMDDGSDDVIQFHQSGGALFFAGPKDEMDKLEAIDFTKLSAVDEEGNIADFGKGHRLSGSAFGVNILWYHEPMPSDLV